MANDIPGFEIFDDDAPSEGPVTTTPVKAEPLKKEVVENQRYLVFVLGENLYATPLLAAREVIEVPDFRAIPNTKDYFLGIANLRGEVVGIIDLGGMFGANEPKTDEKQSVIICESRSGPLGAKIDGIRGVVSMNESEITKEVSIKSHVPQEYIRGVGKLESDELAIVLDLDRILDEDDFVSLKKAQQAAV